MIDPTGDDPISAPDLTSSSEILEQFLADAEREIAAIRAELASRRLEGGHTAVAALPEDLSKVQGRWADLRSFLSEMLRRDS